MPNVYEILRPNTKFPFRFYAMGFLSFVFLFVVAAAVFSPVLYASHPIVAFKGLEFFAFERCARWAPFNALARQVVEFNRRCDGCERFLPSLPSASGTTSDPFIRQRWQIN